MTKGTFVVLMLLLTNSLVAQTTDRQYELKLYSNFEYNTQFIYPNLNSVQGVNFTKHDDVFKAFSFSPAFAYKTGKGNSSELEISSLNYKKQVHSHLVVRDTSLNFITASAGNIKSTFHVFLRYEYKVSLFKKKRFENFDASLAFSASPFYIWNEYEPYSSTEFAYSNSTVGVLLSLIPRFEYHFNDKWYLDLNFPIRAANFDLTSTNIDDPTLPVLDRKSRDFDYFDGPFGYSARLGIGMRI